MNLGVDVINGGDGVAAEYVAEEGAEGLSLIHI